MLRLVAVAFVATTVALATDKQSDQESVKTDSAAGYYGGAADQPTVNTQPVYYPVFPPPPRLEDRNVCDLDASVLLVTNHRRHGEYKAIRVRCSEIANYDEDSCNVCCQNAARRDRNLMNGAMFGFLALTDEKKERDRKDRDDSRKDSPEDLDRDEDDSRRVKRGADHSREYDVDRTYVKEDNWKPDPQYKNVKCVCCAPKRPLPVFTFPIYNQQPQYAAPVQSYGQAAPQGYGQPQAPPANYQPAAGYQPPAQSPPQGYQQPQQAPPAAPAYQAPQQTPQPY